MRDVYIAGSGLTDFGKFHDTTLKDLAAVAVTDALADAGARVDGIEAAFVGNAVAGLITGQEMIRGQVMLRPLGFAGIPVFNVENACASASSAFHLAHQAVASGAYDVALAVGAEKLTHEDKQRSFDAIATAVDLEQMAEMEAALGSGSGRSFFMDIYAGMTKDYFAASGATQDDLARVVVKAHDHAALNPKAQYRNIVTMEQVLGAREIAWPLTLLMCSPIGDGAAAVVVASREGLERLEREADRPDVRVLASVVRSGTMPGHDPKSARAAGQAAYDASGVGPEDVDVAEIHDATAVAELTLYEDLSFCPPGDGPKLLATGRTHLRGDLPVNPSGGLLCKGHPIGATGIAQLAELNEQLLERAGDRQVGGARIALAENGGGWLDEDSAAMSVTILARD